MPIPPTETPLSQGDDVLECLALLDQWLDDSYDDASAASGRWLLADSGIDGEGCHWCLFSNGAWPLIVKASWRGGAVSFSETDAGGEIAASEYSPPSAVFSESEAAPFNGWAFELIGSSADDGSLVVALANIENGPVAALGANDCDGCLPPGFSSQGMGLFSTALSPAEARSFLLAAGFAQEDVFGSPRESELAELEEAAGSRPLPPMAPPVVEAAIRSQHQRVSLLAGSATEDALFAAVLEASKRGHASCLSVLAPLFPANSLGGEPLFCAAANGRDESLRVLDRRGVDLFRRDASGLDAAGIAAKNQRPEFLRALFSAWTVRVEDGALSTDTYYERVKDASNARSDDWMFDVEVMGHKAFCEREPQILAAQEARIFDKAIRQGPPSKTSNRI